MILPILLSVHLEYAKGREVIQSCDVLPNWISVITDHIQNMTLSKEAKIGW